MREMVREREERDSERKNEACLMGVAIDPKG